MVNRLERRARRSRRSRPNPHTARKGKKDGRPCYFIYDEHGNKTHRYCYSQSKADQIIARLDTRSAAPQRAAPPIAPTRRPAPAAPAPVPAPRTPKSKQMDEWAVISRSQRFASASMTRKEAEKLAGDMKSNIVPDWDPWECGLDLEESGNIRHDAAQDVAAEQWRAEAREMQAASDITVVSGQEARAYKEEMLRQQSGSGGHGAGPWSGYSGHGRGGFGSSGGWGPGGGRGGWGGR